MTLTRCIALLQFLLALSGCGLGATTYSNRIADNGHDVLASKARAQDGVARFECVASDSGWCHYTLYPEACRGRADCSMAPLQRFAVARGDSRQLAGLAGFRVCVATTTAAMGPDCQPRVATASR